MILSALLILGGLFGLTGSYGLLRLKMPLQRLHSAMGIVGLGAILIVSAVQSGGWHQVLILLFLLTTAPISTLFLARLHLKSLDLPPTGNDSTWSGAENP